MPPSVLRLTALAGATTVCGRAAKRTESASLQAPVYTAILSSEQAPTLQGDLCARGTAVTCGKTPALCAEVCVELIRAAKFLLSLLCWLVGRPASGMPPTACSTTGTPCP
jgi:hypothetical protein